MNKLINSKVIIPKDANLKVNLTDTLEEFLKTNYVHLGLNITVGDRYMAQTNPKENFAIFLSERLTEKYLNNLIVLYYHLKGYVISKDKFTFYVQKDDESLKVHTTSQNLFPPPVLYITVSEVD